MLKDTFCSSPWFHIRIDSQGYYRPCRWASLQVESTCHRKDYTLTEYYNSDEMKSFRQDLLNGKQCDQCRECYQQDKIDKVSGRIRQLFKSNIDVDNFTKSFAASAHYDMFEYSANNNGESDYHIVDFQVDLGNTCNGACIMCHPFHSSKLMPDFDKLQPLEPTMFNNPPLPENWTNDEDNFGNFIIELIKTPEIKYLHLLGGETLVMPQFYKICDALISANKASETIIGTTTNCTVFDSRIGRYMDSFKQLHLGLSIESVTELNDYIRYPSKIKPTLEVIDKFCSLRKYYKHKLLLLARLTPNLLSIFEMDQMMNYLLEKNIPAETCNIFSDPKQLKMELLPDDIKQMILNKLNYIILKNNLSADAQKVVDTRNTGNIEKTLNDLIVSFIDILENAPTPTDTNLSETVRFLKAFEGLRNNTILDYLPEYEEFLRHSGY